MPVLGITGGVGTGKSTASALLAQLLPADLFDADLCARELTDADPEVRLAIAETFGDEIFGRGGTPDRRRLREIVFSDPAKRAALESILHPAVRVRWLAQAEQARRDAKWLCVDVPLLFETGGEKWCECVAVVACSTQTQYDRLQRSRGMSHELAEMIIASQLDLGIKIKKSDIVIWNDSTTSCLAAQARLLAEAIRERHG